MRNASSHQCKVKMSGSEKKVNDNTYDIPSIKHGLRSFWKFHIVVVQNNGKEMNKKSVLHVQSCFFANWIHCYFHRSAALPSSFSITRFHILFEQTMNIIESFAISPG